MTDLPPPDPSTRATAGEPERDPAAEYADAALGWVGRQHVAIRILVWVLLWLVLAPLMIVRRTNGSKGGMIGAFSLMLVGGALVSAPFVEDPDTAPVAAELAEASEDATEAGEASEVEAEAAEARPSVAVAIAKSVALGVTVARPSTITLALAEADRGAGQCVTAR